MLTPAQPVRRSLPRNETLSQPAGISSACLETLDELPGRANLQKTVATFTLLVALGATNLLEIR